MRGDGGGGGQGGTWVGVKECSECDGLVRSYKFHFILQVYQRRSQWTRNVFLW